MVKIVFSLRLSGQSSTLEPELAIEDTDSNSPLGELQLNLAIKSDVTSSGLPSPGQLVLYRSYHPDHMPLIILILVISCP